MIVFSTGQFDDLLKALECRSRLAFQFYRIRFILRGILKRPSSSTKERSDALDFFDTLLNPISYEEIDTKIYPSLEADDKPF